jgi:ABC-2 type transport system permease protein
VGVATIWSSSSFSFPATVGLFYHLLTIHGLWYAPLYGWMLLVSAWAPRAPIIWAVVPPFVIWAVEKIAFNTSYFLKMLEYRVNGPDFAGSAMHSSPPMGSMVTPTPLTFFILPGLWLGLAIAAAFLAGAVRLRRYRGPI